MPLIEVCVDSLDSLARAQAGGAQRLELCSRLDLDGLSPGPELLEAALAAACVPVVVMVRPSPGSFVTQPADLARMRVEVAALSIRPVAGVVLGLLTSEGRVDRSAVASLVELAGPLPVVFHRAFDRCHDLLEALEDLVDLGVTRILTSGGAPNAYDGRARLRELLERAAGRIEILAGGGIRDHNLAALLAATGVEQVHASLPLRDRS